MGLQKQRISSRGPRVHKSTSPVDPRSSTLVLARLRVSGLAVIPRQYFLEARAVKSGSLPTKSWKSQWPPLARIHIACSDQLPSQYSVERPVVVSCSQVALVVCVQRPTMHPSGAASRRAGVRVMDPWTRSGQRRVLMMVGCLQDASGQTGQMGLGNRQADKPHVGWCVCEVWERGLVRHLRRRRRVESVWRRLCEGPPASCRPGLQR